jgi:DNA-binding MarR family transcriptional regulator
VPLLLLKELPRFECLLEASLRYPDLHPESTEAFLHLLRTTDLVFAADSSLLARHQLSPGRFTVLMQLNRHPGQPETPATLADAAGVTRATMTGLLDTLEKDGLVKRSPAPSDRRLTLIQLTEAGTLLLERVIPEYFRNVAGMMGALSEDERAQLVRLLQKIESQLPQPSGQEPAPGLQSAQNAT